MLLDCAVVIDAWVISHKIPLLPDACNSWVDSEGVNGSGFNINK